MSQTLSQYNVDGIHQDVDSFFNLIFGPLVNLCGDSPNLELIGKLFEALDANGSAHFNAVEEGLKASLNFVEEGSSAIKAHILGLCISSNPAHNVTPEDLDMLIEWLKIDAQEDILKDEFCFISAVIVWWLEQGAGKTYMDADNGSLPVIAVLAMVQYIIHHSRRAAREGTLDINGPFGGRILENFFSRFGTCDFLTTELEITATGEAVLRARTQPERYPGDICIILSMNGTRRRIRTGATRGSSVNAACVNGFALLAQQVHVHERLPYIGQLLQDTHMPLMTIVEELLPRVTYTPRRARQISPEIVRNIGALMMAKAAELQTAVMS